MKHVIGSLSIGAFILLSSAAVVLAADPHTATGTKGQPGTVNPVTGLACGGATFIGGAPIASAPGNGSAANAVNSPFGSSPPAYAGSASNPTAGTANNSAHAVSEYDVACFQAP